MSDTRDPQRDQQLPIGNDQTPVHDLVIEDLKERKAHGTRKYGQPLQPFNGRSFLQDAYEEVLDLAAYLRGKLEEERQAAPEPAFDHNTVVMQGVDGGFYHTYSPECPEGCTGQMENCACRDTERVFTND